MKVDFKKSLPGYAAKRNQFSIIELPKMQCSSRLPLRLFTRWRTRSSS